MGFVSSSTSSLDIMLRDRVADGRTGYLCRKKKFPKKGNEEMTL
jgi:hypothetical protein